MRFHYYSLTVQLYAIMKDACMLVYLSNNSGYMMLKLQVRINVHTKVIYKFNIREDEIVQGSMTGDYGIVRIVRSLRTWYLFKLICNCHKLDQLNSSSMECWRSIDWSVLLKILCHLRSSANNSTIASPHAFNSVFCVVFFSSANPANECTFKRWVGPTVKWGYFGQFLPSNFYYQ
jgi:hypothetical protein